MSITTLAIIAAIVIATVAIVALALYKIGFRLEELKIKLGLAEATLAREPGDKAIPSSTPVPPTGVEQIQDATGPDSLIADSSQQAGAPEVKQQQSATGGGQIRGSSQTATTPASQQQRASDGGHIENSSQQAE